MKQNNPKERKEKKQERANRWKSSGNIESRVDLTLKARSRSIGSVYVDYSGSMGKIHNAFCQQPSTTLASRRARVRKEPKPVVCAFRVELLSLNNCNQLVHFS